MNIKRVFTHAGRMLALLAIALPATAISCTPPAETRDPPANEHAAGETKPAAASRATGLPAAAIPSATDYERDRRLFGESLLAGQYAAAYDLTSSRLRGRMSLEKFTDVCQQAVQQFGKAVQLGKVIIDQTGGLAGCGRRPRVWVSGRYSRCRPPGLGSHGTGPGRRRGGGAALLRLLDARRKRRRTSANRPLQLHPL